MDRLNSSIPTSLELHKEFNMILYFLFNKGRTVLNPNLNSLRHAPSHIRYFATVLLGCFWCLAFGLYFKDFELIGFNMLGHIAVISMAFITWTVFKQFDQIYNPTAGTQDWLRMPDRGSRCDEMTDEQRVSKIDDLKNRSYFSVTNTQLITCSISTNRFK